MIKYLMLRMVDEDNNYNEYTVKQLETMMYRYKAIRGLQGWKEYGTHSEDNQTLQKTSLTWRENGHDYAAIHEIRTVGRMTVEYIEWYKDGYKCKITPIEYSVKRMKEELQRLAAYYNPANEGKYNTAAAA